MTQALYLLGAPGVGKSTVMARLLEDWTPGPYERLTEREMFGHYMLNSDLDIGLYLGHLRSEYPGTDALSLSVAPQAMLWLQSLNPKVNWVFGEGVRLGHPAFLHALHLRTDLTVVHLVLDPAEAAARRTARGGKLLSESYCKLATSRAINAAQACREAGLRVLEIDAGNDLSDTTSAILLDRVR